MMAEFLSGKRRDFDVPVEAVGSPHQQRILR